MTHHLKADDRAPTTATMCVAQDDVDVVAVTVAPQSTRVGQAEKSSSGQKSATVHTNEGHGKEPFVHEIDSIESFCKQQLEASKGPPTSASELHVPIRLVFVHRMLEDAYQASQTRTRLHGGYFFGTVATLVALYHAGQVLLDDEVACSSSYGRLLLG